MNLSGLVQVGTVSHVALAYNYPGTQTSVYIQYHLRSNGPPFEKPSWSPI